uniref:Uncharacterized protein C9orf114 n=1 Tax=Lygus hesperus TaxID=30085 RepID=A0A146KQS3_LYGHE
MALKNDKLDWRTLKTQKKKRKLEQVEKYLETKKKLEIVEQSDEKPAKKSSLAIAIAGSIVDNIQTEELATYVAGQIARAAAIYKVDEVIVFDDTCSTAGIGKDQEEPQTWSNCVWMAKILQYLECPQYLRKQLFPLGRDYRYAGLLNPLDTPHHLRRESVSVYREGVVLEKVHTQLQQSYVFVGLEEDVRIDRQLEPGLRVTVKLNPDGGNRGTAVSPREPKSTLGIYWGYEVRLAKSFSAIFTESPHKKGYNLTIGTSDKGTPLGSVTFKSKKRRRALLVIGGVKGLEFALSNDDSLGTQDVALTFDHYVNVCPDQGSRTIRSEEALLISLALITDKLNNS